MKLDYVLGVRPWLCNQEPVGELVHGTGYHDRCGNWKNGRQWVRRYPDAKPRNDMNRHALRARGAFRVLREMPGGHKYAVAFNDMAKMYSACVPLTSQDAQAQAVTVLTHMLHWMNEAGAR